MVSVTNATIAWQQDSSYTAEQDRSVIAALISSTGVRDGASLEVTPTTGMNVFVSPGVGAVRFGTADRFVFSVPTQITVPVAAAHPLYSRIDSVVAIIHDTSNPAETALTNSLEIIAVPGPAQTTPTPPSLPNLPLVELAQITISPRATTINTVDIEDLRTTFGGWGSLLARDTVNLNALSLPLSKEIAYSQAENTYVIGTTKGWANQGGERPHGTVVNSSTLALNTSAYTNITGLTADITVGRFVNDWFSTNGTTLTVNRPGLYYIEAEMRGNASSPVDVWIRFTFAGSGVNYLFSPAPEPLFGNTRLRNTVSSAISGVRWLDGGTTITTAAFAGSAVSTTRFAVRVIAIGS